MRRSVRAALERIAEERAKSAVNKAVRDVTSQHLDFVRNEIAIAKAFSREDTVRALRLVESQIVGATSEDS